MFNILHWPPWAVMWMLAGSIYVGCKWLTWRRRTHVDGIPWWKHAGYLIAWPGMDATAFLTQRPTTSPSAREWIFAAIKFALGVALFFAGSAAAGAGADAGAAAGVAAGAGADAGAAAADSQSYAGWIGMVGIVLTLHFGLFHLLACAWRQAGVEARPLMDRPLTCASVSEFWSRRWNTAFRDLTHRFLFRPLTPWLGVRGAIVGGFVFSGVVHDVVISIPARGGYGGPTLFFVCQAAAILVERSTSGRRLGLGRGAAGRVFTAIVLLAPVSCLFHPPFVERIVVPFMLAMGAL